MAINDNIPGKVAYLHILPPQNADVPEDKDSGVTVYDANIGSIYFESATSFFADKEDTGYVEVYENKNRIAVYFHALAVFQGEANYQ